MKVRKNAASLSTQEWVKFMKAVIGLKHTFAAGSTVSLYDQFVAIHWGVTNLTGAQTRDGGHRGPAFLSWHREYLRRFEVALQFIDPEVTIPYWNWGLGDLSQTTSLFRDDRIGRMGSGGASNFAIETGYLALNANAFNPMGWAVRSDMRQPFFTPEGNGLERNSFFDTSRMPTATDVNGTLASPDFSTFRPALEGNTRPGHNILHGLVGRDMATMTSPNDPIFYLHHAQVDRLWAKWQKDHPGSTNFNPLGTGGQGHKIDDNMWPWDAGASQTAFAALANLIPAFAQTDVVKARDILNHRDLGYCYDDEDDCPCAGRSITPPTRPLAETPPTTLAIGEEGPIPTTLRVGEEAPPTTFRFGEEGGPTWVEDGPLTAVEDGPVINPDTPFGTFPNRR